MAGRLLGGNRLTARQRIARGYAGVCFRWQPPAGVDSPPVSLHVGDTPHGRGLFLDQRLLKRGAAVASFSGALVELHAPPHKSDGAFYLERGAGPHGGRLYFKLDPASVDHPGNIVNTAMRGKNERSNVRIEFRPALENVALLVATRRVEKGEELLLDYSGDPGFARRMRREDRRAAAAAEAVTRNLLAAEGRAATGAFTPRNVDSRRCPKCGIAPPAFNNGVRREHHIRLCSGRNL